VSKLKSKSKLLPEKVNAVKRNILEEAHHATSSGKSELFQKNVGLA